MDPEVQKKMERNRERVSHKTSVREQSLTSIRASCTCGWSTTIDCKNDRAQRDWAHKEAGRRAEQHWNAVRVK